MGKNNKILIALLCIAMVITGIALPDGTVDFDRNGKTETALAAEATTTTGGAVTTESAVTTEPAIDTLEQEVPTTATVGGVSVEKRSGYGKDYNHFTNSEGREIGYIGIWWDSLEPIEWEIPVVITVTGAALHLLSLDAVDFSAVQITSQGSIKTPDSDGITISSITTKTAITTAAETVTFAAVMNISKQTYTGEYSLVASTSAIVNGGFNGEVVHISVNYFKWAMPGPRICIQGNPFVIMGIKEKAAIAVEMEFEEQPQEVADITASSSKKNIVNATIKNQKKLVLQAKKKGKAKVTLHYGEIYEELSVTVKKVPNNLTLVKGKQKGKNLSFTANTKKKAIKKKYTIRLPKNTASYGYTIKVSGKAKKKVKAKLYVTEKGVQQLRITVKKKAKGNAIVTLRPNANKKVKATVKIKAVK